MLESWAATLWSKTETGSKSAYLYCQEEDRPQRPRQHAQNLVLAVHGNAVSDDMLESVCVRVEGPTYLKR